jgi:ADP-ribose pyrophosphatase YjhB (NUDIX family)
MTENVIKAAGGLVYRRTRKKSREYEILIVHRPKYDDWSLPKGKLLTAELWEDGAKREVLEETGQRVKIQSFAGPVIYQVAGALKLVLFWRMSIIRRAKFKPTSEVDKIKWVTTKQAMRWLSYTQDKELISKTLIDP